MENVTEVTTAMHLKGSTLNKAPMLKTVGSLYFNDSKISDLRSLEEISGIKVTWIKQLETSQFSK